MSINKIIGRNISVRRRELGVDGTEFGRVIGVSQSTISSIENGQCSISIERLIRVAEALGTTVISLIEEPRTLESDICELVSVCRRLDDFNRGGVLMEAFEALRRQNSGENDE